MKNRNMSIIANVVLSLAVIICVVPFVFLISSSLTSEMSLIKNGYNFWPNEFSTYAYEYLWRNSKRIIQAYSMTVITTVIGVVIGLSITTMFAYVISRKDFPLRKVLSFMVFFTMLFNGGLVPTYILYTNFWGIKNTLLGQIIPALLMNGFFVMIMRAYFSNNLPLEILESARVDGAGEIGTFFKIVVPLSLPILATVGLFIAVNYWNDWYNGLIYITDSKLFTMQNFLNRLINDMKMLATMGDAGGGVTSIMPTASVRMAIAVIAVLPILIAYPFFQKYFIKGIAIGGVKG
ncbi:MAG: carbohydrate ABC transporter permease [Clostridiales bacterium]